MIRFCNCSNPRFFDNVAHAMRRTFVSDVAEASRLTLERASYYCAMQVTWPHHVCMASVIRMSCILCVICVVCNLSDKCGSVCHSSFFQAVSP